MMSLYKTVHSDRQTWRKNNVKTQREPQVKMESLMCLQAQKYPRSAAKSQELGEARKSPYSFQKHVALLTP